jgi:hypothetical protein
LIRNTEGLVGISLVAVSACAIGPRAEAPSRASELDCQKVESSRQATSVSEPVESVTTEVKTSDAQVEPWTVDLESPDEPKEDRLFVLPIGTRSGALLGEAKQTFSGVMTNAPYGGLGENVETYLVLFCAHGADDGRAYEMLIRDGNVNHKLDVGYNVRPFSLFGATCSGGVFRLEGCRPIDVSLQREGQSFFEQKYWFDCKAGG